MKCEVCGCAYRKIESSLICQNGHTLQNMTEVAHDDIAPSARVKRIKKNKKTKDFYKSSGCNLMKLVLCKLVFEEAKIFFDFPEDLVFKYFTGFFEFREGKLDSSLEISKEMIFSIIYLAKRADNERKGVQLFFDDFLAKFKDFDFCNRLTLIKNRFQPLEPPVTELRYSTSLNTVQSLKRKIELLTSPYRPLRPYSMTVGLVIRHTVYAGSLGNGIFEEVVDGNKFNIRSLFKNDIPTFLPYFIQICKYFEISITEELNFYFEKYIYTFDNTQLILPEYDFVMFIAMFLINKNEFENTEIESKILNYFEIQKVTMMAHISILAREYNNFVSPEVYLSSLKKNNRQRFGRLRDAIRFVDTYKVTKAVKMDDQKCLKQEVESIQTPVDCEKKKIKNDKIKKKIKFI